MISFPFQSIAIALIPLCMKCAVISIAAYDSCVAMTFWNARRLMRALLFLQSYYFYTNYQHLKTI